MDVKANQAQEETVVKNISVRQESGMKANLGEEETLTWVNLSKEEEIVVETMGRPEAVFWGGQQVHVPTVPQQEGDCR